MSEPKNIIYQKDKKISNPSNIVFAIIAATAIYFMILPILYIDISAYLYQEIYFTLRDIPKIDRSDYVIFDRAKLSKLNRWTKINCIYCEYANGVLAWVKSVANQTEIYSCAIKHSTVKKGQEHQKDFYSYDDFED